MSRWGWPILDNEKNIFQMVSLAFGISSNKGFLPHAPIKERFPGGEPKYLFCFGGETQCQDLGNPSLVTVLEKAIYIFHLNVKIFKADLLACTFLCRFWLPFPTHGDHLKDKRKRYQVLSFFPLPSLQKNGFSKNSPLKGHCVYGKQLSKRTARALPHRRPPG